MNNRIPILFKPRFQIWLFRVYIPIGLLIIAIIQGILLVNYGLAVIIGGVIIIGWIIIELAIPLSQVQLRIDNIGLTGTHMHMSFLLPLFDVENEVTEEYLDQIIPKYTRGFSFDFRFNEIEALWLGSDRFGKPTIWVATALVTAIIPVRWLSGKEVWKSIELFASKSKLEEEARENASVIKAWTAHNQAFLDNFTKQFLIEIKKGILFVGYIVLIFLGYILYIAIIEKSLWAIIFFGIPEYGTLKFVFEYPKRFSMDKEGLKIATYFRKYEVRWEDIQKFSSDGSFMIFYQGKSKYLIPQVHNWAGDDIKEAHALIKAQINVQGYEIIKLDPAET